MDLTLAERAFLANDIESAVTNECLGDDEDIYKKFENIAYKMIDRRPPLEADERKLLANWLTGLCDCPEFFDAETTEMRRKLAAKLWPETEAE